MSYDVTHRDLQVNQSVWNAHMAVAFPILMIVDDNADTARYRLATSYSKTISQTISLTWLHKMFTKRNTLTIQIPGDLPSFGGIYSSNSHATVLAVWIDMASKIVFALLADKSVNVEQTPRTIHAWLFIELGAQLLVECFVYLHRHPSYGWSWT